MGLFKRKKKYNSKYEIGEFISFHMNDDLKHGVIFKIKEIDGKVLYDIKVGGEATWLARNIAEEKIIRNKPDGVIHNS